MREQFPSWVSASSNNKTSVSPCIKVSSACVRVYVGEELSTQSTPGQKDIGNNSDSDNIDETEAEVKVQKKSLHLFAVKTSLGHGSECRKRRNRSRAQDAPDVESRNARRYFRMHFDKPKKG